MIFVVGSNRGQNRTRSRVVELYSTFAAKSAVSGKKNGWKGLVGCWNTWRGVVFACLKILKDVRSTYLHNMYINE